MKHSSIEKVFDINVLLMTLYGAVESIREEKGIELLFDIEPSVPREMKGDEGHIVHVLTHFLTFVLPYSVYKEIVLHIDSPKDFLYEENVTFYFDAEAIDIGSLKIENFFQSRLKTLLDMIEANGFVEQEQRKVGIAIPLKVKEIGNRRHYRLPDIRMMGKKVLLITQSTQVARIIAKMFRYFLYEVDEGVEAYKKRGSNLAAYDIFVLDESLYTAGIQALVEQVRAQKDLKFVLIRKATPKKWNDRPLVSAYLITPVLQESVFELILALYQDEVQSGGISMDREVTVIDMERHIDRAFSQSQKAYAEMIQKQASNRMLFEPVDVLTSDPVFNDEELNDLPVLDSEEGQRRCKETGIDYHKALKDFIDKFRHSDYYFRDIARGKAIVQMKQFARDLEAHAFQIGAKRMVRLAQSIELLFVYNKFDAIPMLINRYHKELNNLIIEISRLSKKERNKS